MGKPVIRYDWADGDGRVYRIIPRAQLEPGRYYTGVSRLTHVAVWDGRVGKFYMLNFSMGEWGSDALPHPEDDYSGGRHEVFRPMTPIPRPGEVDFG